MTLTLTLASPYKAFH